MVDLQDKLKEEPRFSPTLFSMFNSETNLEDEEVWSLVNLWQTLANERVGAVRKKKTDEVSSRHADIRGPERDPIQRSLVP